jgi:hypothetical protein
MVEKPKRKFYLPDGVVLGLSRFDGKIGKDGLIDISKLDEAQMEELERMAATDGHPVTESEPEGVK